MTFYSFLFLFFAYSFLGWVGEVLYTAVTRRRYQDRGVLSGPLCILYGIGAHLISFALRDLSNDSWFFLAVFSAVYATVIEWVAGHILERTSHTRWWDYSDMPFNLDGYVCLGASALWGVLGVVAVKWGNPLLLALYGLLPHRLIAIILWAALVILPLTPWAPFWPCWACVTAGPPGRRSRTAWPTLPSTPAWLFWAGSSSA